MGKTKKLDMKFEDLPYRVIVNDVLHAAFADKENAEDFINALCEAAITGDTIALVHGERIISGFDADSNEYKL